MNIKDLMLYAGVGKENYDEIEELVQDGNRKNLKGFSSIAAGLMLVMLLMSFFVDKAAENKLFYAFAFFGMLLNILESTVYYKKSKKLMHISLYFFMGILYAFGILVGTVTNSDQICTSFIALLLCVPVLFVLRPIFMNMANIIAVIVFCIVASQFKSADILTTDYVNVTIFGLASCCVGTYMMRVKAERYVFENKTIMMSETDLLTGLKNRNCYETKLGNYPDECENTITCVYIDVNGLHELNNSEGHHAGDIMLQTVAGELRDAFGKEDTFRVGGDEFVAFVKDGEEKAISAKVSSVISNLENSGYHISAGFVSEKAQGCNMHDLIKAAEAIMYDEKRKYYESKGMNRTNIRM